MTIFGSPRTSHFIPRTPVFVRVFQTLEVTIIGSTSVFIPRKFSCAYFKHSRSAKDLHPKDVFMRVLQTLEMTIWQLQNKSIYPKDICFRARISNTRGDHILAAISHTNKSIPPSSTQRTSIFVRVFQTLEVTIFGSQRTSPFIPRTSVFVRVFQTLEMTIFGSSRTSPSVQGHPFSCVFQTLEATIFGSISTSIFIPRTSFFVCVFQTLEVTFCGSSRTNIYPEKYCYPNFYPNDTRFRAHIVDTRGDHFGQL